MTTHLSDHLKIKLFNSDDVYKVMQYICQNSNCNEYDGSYFDVHLFPERCDFENIRVSWRGALLY